MRRVRTAAGAARYKQPIGSIIVTQGGGKKPLNLSHMDDGHLMDLMHDQIAQQKNPDIYEAAAAEWSRRQPPLEEPSAPFPDPWDEPDPTRTDRLDMMTAERDAAYARLASGAHVTDSEWQDDADRYEVYSELIANEQKLAATNSTPQGAVPGLVEERPQGDGASTVEVSAATRKRWAIMEQADQLAEAEGISYEDALGRVQGLDPEQVRRREAVRRGTELGYSSTSFNALVDEIHHQYVSEMELRMEDATNGHFIATEHKNNPEFWKWWNNNGKSLFSMTDAEARKYLSPEAREYLDSIGGRVTKSDVVALIEQGKLSENFEPDSIQAAFSNSETRFRRGDYLQ
ncbi:hypothetical protein ACK8HH_17145 [Gordonia sp. LUNF6]|uniref:hypothetical protein n=1 Tax=unclassified Gordonia (in: high G+C Gram-positive bacteria) TaxID=2657482 RepID=UPI000785CD17|nr:hypothetical protein [Gordonia sp. QH-12]KXT55664.1 hypothetical protein Y710_18075 [Gordonia sp. QH-12]